MKTQLIIIGAPSSAGARKHGQERGPEILRKAGLVSALNAVDLGDLPLVRYEPDAEHPKAQNLKLVAAVTNRVADRVAANVQKFVLIGGDCTITLGALAGLKHRTPNLGLLYFDGDIDMHTPSDTTSGILDGMGLAHITGHADNELTNVGGAIEEGKIVAFGFNSQSGFVDPPEQDRFERTAIMKYPVHQIRAAIGDYATSVRSALENKVDAFLLHFDVDVLDDADFPVADVAHHDGLKLDQAAIALRTFWHSPKCAGLVITEFNANRDPDLVHATRLVATLAEVL